MQRRLKPIGFFRTMLCSIVLTVILGMFGLQGEWVVWVSFGICFLGYIGMRLPQTYTLASASPTTSATAVRQARLPPVPESNSRYISDRTGNDEFPFPRQVVFRALCDAVSGIRGMEIAKRDELASRLDINTGMSALSWGENVSVTVSGDGDQAAIMSVQSASKAAFGSATTYGKNRKT